MTGPNETGFLEVAERGLAWARARDYTGYNKHDALNSPLLSGLSLGNKWLRIAFTQAVMRSPLQLRPLLGVRKAPNPKGFALFARAWLNHHQVTGNETSAREAAGLLDRLVERPSDVGLPGLSWGYGYPWQDLGFYAPTDFPNRIVTYFVGRALVHGFEVLGDERYLDAALEVARFLLEAPRVLHEDEATKCLSYVPVDDIRVAVMDVSCLCGALLAMISRHANRDDLQAEGRRLVAWVVDKQLPSGAWYYTDPPGDSLITHDNYHTGEIVDSLEEYRLATGDDSFRESWRKGLDYYRENLFTADWRPKWMNDKVHPHDIHGYAQGIISFTNSGELDLAGRIAEATIQDMWVENEDRFRYQRRRHLVHGFTLMRWCQAWACFALTSLERARAQAVEGAP